MPTQRASDWNILPGLATRERVFEVPLDHARPDGPSIEIFAREVERPEHIRGSAARERPMLIFLQGGPGFGAPRPGAATGWVGRALAEYRVLMIDQRGTGRSTPICAESMAARELEHDPEGMAEFFALFRSDAIVRDCELIRQRMLGDAPWTVLGQSYGGFCGTRYLCDAPEGLAGVIFTGGLPPLRAHPDEIYRATYERLRARNNGYYRRYPEDVARVRAVFEHVASREVRLPEGGVLTPRKLQQLGLLLGYHDGYEFLHYLFENPWVAGAAGDTLSYRFLRGFEHALPYDTNPIYSVLHEHCYTQGFASRWSAHRVRAEFPAFAEYTREGRDPAAPVLFTGEMVYPWMFEEWPRLRTFARAAELLAQRESWPVLYDPATLARNTVPCAAVIYDEDMYVERRFSSETAQAIAGLRAWVTNEHPHSGLRAAGERVLGRLLDMLHDRA